MKLPDSIKTSLKGTNFTKRFVMVCMVISLLFCSCGHRAGNPHPDTVLEKNNANLYLDTFVGRKEQLFAFIPKAEASDGKKDPVEENFDRHIVEQIRKTYAQLGSPANGYVEPDLGIYFAQGDMGLIFEESEAMSAWYGQYFESGKVPADVVKRVMQGDEKCVGMFFFLRDIGIKQEIMPDPTIVGKAEENPLDGSYGYYFIQNGYQVRLDCTESGTITGDSYCLVYLAQ